jgi:ABC-type hemin transport system substrate-binding protein
VIDMRDDQILGFGPQFPGTLRALHRALSAAEEIR